MIRVAKEAGFSLTEIERLLQGFEPDAMPSERWRVLAEGKLAELDDLASRIDGMRALLRRGIACGCLRLEDCVLVRDAASAEARSG